MNQILSLGVSGHPMGGADIPGFSGIPTDDLFVQFYQLGIYFPFMRAHSTIENQHREPWIQSDRV